MTLHKLELLELGRTFKMLNYVINNREFRVSTNHLKSQINRAIAARGSTCSNDVTFAKSTHEFPNRILRNTEKRGMSKSIVFRWKRKDKDDSLKKILSKLNYAFLQFPPFSSIFFVVCFSIEYRIEALPKHSNF